jgi:hypothetical protein
MGLCYLFGAILPRFFRGLADQQPSQSRNPKFETPKFDGELSWLLIIASGYVVDIPEKKTSPDCLSRIDIFPIEFPGNSMDFTKNELLARDYVHHSNGLTMVYGRCNYS